MKKLVLIALITVIATGTVFAQGMGMTGWTSPQSTATQGRMRSDADNFIRPDSYVNVNFDSWYGMTSFGSQNRAHLGFATMLGGGGEEGEGGGGIYLAGYWGGNFWAGRPTVIRAEYTGDWLDNNNVTVTEFDIPTLNQDRNNRFGILLGVANMGFRFTFYTNRTSFDESNFTDGTLDYRSYEAKLGSVRPQIAWSMATDLLERGIKPYITLDIDFFNNYTKTDTYISNTESIVAVGNSRNQTDTIIRAGLGGLHVFRQDAFRLTADLDYQLSIRGYSNEFTYLDVSNNMQVGTIKGLNRNGDISFNSRSSNLFIPSLAGQWRDGPLSLRFRLELPLTITNYEDSAAWSPLGVTVKNGVSTETTTVGFAPDLRLAAQWAVAPKLTINTGGRLWLNDLSRVTVTSKEHNPIGEVVEGTSGKIITRSSGSFSNELTLGATLRATDNLTFEAVSGVGSGNQLSVFGATNGMFVFSSLLVGLKF
jgi:hypothetical protein